MKYHLLDANNKVLGRLATRAAVVLRGKNKLSFVPHQNSGDAVVIINSDKVRVSGSKSKKKMYHRFSGYPGGITAISFEDQLKKDSREIVRNAINGMLAKNKLKKEMLKKLFIYKNEKHPHKIDDMNENPN